MMNTGKNPDTHLHSNSMFRSFSSYVGGTAPVLKCQFVYRLIVSDTNAKHIQNMEHLHEANRYAQWSEQDRRSKLPPITEEQRQQIYDYLSVVQQHGLTKSLAAATAQASAEGDGTRTATSTTSPKCPVGDIHAPVP